MTNPPIPPAVVEAMKSGMRLWLPDVHEDALGAIAKSALSAALATGEIVIREDHEDAIRAAFIAGCEAVHNNYQEDRAPDFTEAAYDYATHDR